MAKYFFSFTFLFFSFFHLLSQEKESLNDTVIMRLSNDQDHYHIDEIVVKAFGRSRRLLDVPGSVTNISRVQIERESPVTVVPLLNRAPGVFAHSGALNTSRITIRGIGARVPYATGKVRAYLNNIPLTNGSGISIVEDIDPSIIQGIEIIKGPATSVYGAGLGGTIIITALNPALRPAGIKNDFQAGSWNLYRNSLSIDTGGEQGRLSLMYSHTQSSGYRQNNDYRRDGLTLVSSAAPLKNTETTLILAFTSLKAHIPSSIDSLTFIESPRSAARNWLQTKGYEDYDKLLAGVSANYRFNSNLAAGLSLFSTMNKEKEMRPFDVLYENRLSAGTRINLAYTEIIPGGSWQLQGGGEFYAENFKYRSFENIEGLGEKGILRSNNSEQIGYFNIFFQTDIDLHRLKASAGINLNSGTTDYTDLFHEGMLNMSGKYSYGNIISPRISANYRYFKSNSVFMTVSHGFSPPSLSETLSPEGSVNPDIKPEKSWNIEGGLRGNLFEHRLFYDINLYSMRVSDLLVAERISEDAWVGKNAGESVHRGIELEIKSYIYRSITLNQGEWWQPAELSISPNLTINNFRFTDFADKGVDYSGKSLPGIPRKIVNAGIYGELHGGLYLLANYKYTGRMPMNDDNSIYSDSYIRTDIKMGLKRDIKNNIKSEVWIGIGNTFNEKYASMILVNAPSFNNNPPRYYYPGNPVNFSAGIRLNYHFN